MPYPDILTPARANLATLVADFDRHPRDLAIVASHGVRQRRVTYAQLATLSRRFAAELATRQIVKGDRILLWGDNGPEWVAAFFGCLLRGAVPVPVAGPDPGPGRTVLLSLGEQQPAGRLLHGRRVRADRGRGRRDNGRAVQDDQPPEVRYRRHPGPGNRRVQHQRRDQGLPGRGRCHCPAQRGHVALLSLVHPGLIQPIGGPGGPADVRRVTERVGCGQEYLSWHTSW